MLFQGGDIADTTSTGSRTGNKVRCHFTIATCVHNVVPKLKALSPSVITGRQARYGPVSETSVAAHVPLF